MICHSSTRACSNPLGSAQGLDLYIRTSGENLRGNTGNKKGLALDTEPQKHDELYECSTPNRPYVLAINRKQETVLVYQPRCKRWDCPYCAKRNVGIWQYVGVYGTEKLQENHAVTFITITCRGYHTPAETLAALGNWPKLRKRIAYTHGETEYVLMPERHKNGRVHAHGIIATERPIKKRWLKDNAYAAGFGYMATADRVKNPMAVIGYVSKYMSKQLEFANWPKGFRRVRKSQGWPMPPKSEVPGWEYEAYTTLGDTSWNCHLWEDMGFQIQWVSEGFVFASQNLINLRD
jgi:hypothetical protein